jgi:hypothetical protein
MNLITWFRLKILLQFALILSRNFRRNIGIFRGDLRKFMPKAGKFFEKIIIIQSSH